jgi:uridine phosphorylase
MGYQAGTICTVISGPTTSAAVIDYDKAIGDTISVGLNAMKELYESS